MLTQPHHSPCQWRWQSLPVHSEAYSTSWVIFWSGLFCQDHFTGWLSSSFYSGCAEWIFVLGSCSFAVDISGRKKTRHSRRWCLFFGMSWEGRGMDLKLISSYSSCWFFNWGFVLSSRCKAYNNRLLHIAYFWISRYYLASPAPISTLRNWKSASILKSP